MRFILATYIFVHGFAHLVGFLTYLRILKSDGLPYKTTLFDGKLDVGDAGIRVVGIFWLIIALGFVYTGILALQGDAAWSTLALATTLASLFFTISGWPDTKLGILANLLLIIFLLADNYFHWIV